MPRSLATTGLAVAATMILSVACSPAPGTSTASPGSTPTPGSTGISTPTAGEPSGSLCETFTEELAAAALGVPLAEPTSGDVLPRPNGIYCNYQALDNSARVEAQLKDMTEAEFADLVDTINTTDPVTGVGEMAFKRDTSIMGDVGVTLVAWSIGRAVTVMIYNPAGQQAQMLEAAKAIAAAVLLH